MSTHLTDAAFSSHDQYMMKVNHGVMNHGVNRGVTH